MPLVPTASDRPRRRGVRKIGAVAAILAGNVLIWLERANVTGGTDAGASCFWIAIAGLLIILGVVELLDRPTRRVKSDDTDQSAEPPDRSTA